MKNHLSPRHTPYHKPANTQGGFSLLEIMIVIVILGLMVGIIAPRLLGRVGEARASKAKQDIQSLESALSLYKMDNFNYPSTQQGLDALVSKPAGEPAAPNWKGSYLQKALPNDPWGKPYQYLNPGARGEVDIYSFGADGQPGGDGDAADVGNWNEKTGG